MATAIRRALAPSKATVLTGNVIELPFRSVPKIAILLRLAVPRSLHGCLLGRTIAAGRTPVATTFQDVCDKINDILPRIVLEFTMYFIDPHIHMIDAIAEAIDIEELAEFCRPLLTPRFTRFSAVFDDF